MTEALLEYQRHFTQQQLVRATLLSLDGSHPELKACVSGLTRDLLELELDDDQLPDKVTIATGDMLELRSGSNGNGFRCRSLLVSGTDSRYLLVRLVGNVIFEELREFFRIDTYLPLRYLNIPGWDEKTVRRQWMERMENLERSRIQPASFIYQGEPDESLPGASNAPIPLEYEPPVAANISGGGLRTCLCERLLPDSYALLELYIPGTPPRLIEVAGKVLYADPTLTQDGTQGYATAFKFTSIDERDRDTLISYIQRIQQQQIRQIAEEMPALSRFRNEISAEFRHGIHPVRRRIGIVVLAALFILLVFAYTSYYLHPTKAEVQRIFDQGLKKYLERLPSRQP